MAATRTSRIIDGHPRNLSPAQGWWQRLHKKSAILWEGTTVILKRNMLALAVASAGLCFTFDAYATVGAGTNDAAAAQPSAAPQDTSATSTDQTATDKNKSQKKDAKDDTQQQKLAKSLDAVTVTGFSSSVEKSIDYQRYADTIQNVVTAADLGGLPDQSIADALTRLPGVSAERIGGQASQINCRGLSGNFIETTLDGREQPSTSGSNYIQFDQYPSELISQATVYKTNQASLIEGGVGCSIDMATANPLDNKKEQSLNVDARGSYDGQAHDVGVNSAGYRFSVAYQAKFLDDTLGVGLGFAQMYQPHVSEQYVGEAFNSYQSPVTTPNGNTAQAYLPEGIQLQQNGGEERRTGYLATVSWRPNENLQITANGYDSKFNNQSFGYGSRSQNFYDASANVTNAIIGSNGALLGGTVNSIPNTPNAQFSNETTADNYSTISNVFSGGLNLKWHDGPWHIEADASLTHSSSNEVNVDATADPYNGLGTANPTLMNQSVTYALNGGQIGTASYANPGIYTNPNDMALSHYGVYPYKYTEKNKALRFNVQYDLDDNPIFSDLQAGVYANNHSYSAERSVWVYGSEWGSYPVTGQPPLPLSSSDSSVACWQGKFSGFPCFLKINMPAVLASYGIVPNPQKQWGPGNSLDWSEVQSGTVSVRERDAYFMADIDTHLFDHELTGNIGMRVARTSQTSDGIQQVSYCQDVVGCVAQGVPMTDSTGVVSSDFIPESIGKSYTNYLPSLNLIYHWDDNDQTRFGASKTFSRPPINQELAGGGSWVSSGQFNVYGNTNALLNPMSAWSYDLNYEHYFDNSSGMFSAGVFFKSVKSFTQDVTYNNFDFASIGITVPNDPTTGKPYLNGEYQTAYNASGGTVRGVELSFTKTHFLPGIWSGLGIGANYAYTKSAVQAISTLGGPPQQQGLPGLSRKVVSASLFYDNGSALTGNITGNYRSSYVSDSQIAVTNQIVYFAPATIWDAQVDYKVNKNVTMEFQVLNFTNQPTRTYFGNQQETGTIQYFGRTFYGGFKVNF